MYEPKWIAYKRARSLSNVNLEKTKILLQKLIFPIFVPLSDWKGLEEEQKMKTFQQANLIVDVLIEAVH